MDARRQTVPRAELRAFALALSSFEGPLLYVTDCAMLLRGWEQGLHRSSGGVGANADMWRLMSAAWIDRPGEVRVAWTPSRVDADGPGQSDWERKMALGN